METVKRLARNHLTQCAQSRRQLAGTLLRLCSCQSMAERLAQDFPQSRWAKRLCKSLSRLRRQLFTQLINSAYNEQKLRDYLALGDEEDS